MRRLSTWALLGVMFGVANSALAQTTITFSEAGFSPGWGPDPYFSGSPKGTLVNTQLASLGLLVSVGNNGVAYIGAPQYVTGTNALGWDQFLAVNSIPPLSQNKALLAMRFVDPNNSAVNGSVDGGSISFRISNYDPSPFVRAIARTYDLSNNVVEEFQLTQYQDVAVFSIGTIHRVEILDSGANGFVLDDFTYGAVTPVPEPATLAIVGAGVAALGLRRRRR